MGNYLNNIPVSVSIPRKLLKKIDDERGDIKRSVWIVRKLECCFPPEEEIVPKERFPGEYYQRQE